MLTNINTGGTTQKSEHSNTLARIWRSHFPRHISSYIRHNVAANSKDRTNIAKKKCGWLSYRLQNSQFHNEMQFTINNSIRRCKVHGSNYPVLESWVRIPPRAWVYAVLHSIVWEDTFRLASHAKCLTLNARATATPSVRWQLSRNKEQPYHQSSTLLGTSKHTANISQNTKHTPRDCYLSALWEKQRST